MTIKQIKELQYVYDNNVVITGIAGSFPEAENVDEFSKKLLSGSSLLTGLSGDVGKLKSVSKFDAKFFGIENGNSLEPADRLLLEKVYEAIIDSGTNQLEIKGSKCGVYIALDAPYPNNNIPVANRISQWLDVHGPSVTIPSCSSVLQQLQFAFDDILNENCESAIVGACTLHSNNSTNDHSLQVDGSIATPKPFDDDAVGLIKSEAVGVIFLQKKINTRRIYAKILAISGNHDGQDSKKAKVELLKTVYNNANVCINDINWIEAEGSAVKNYDQQEVDVLAEVFKDNRSPILIGSVKSNIGDSGAASGIASIIKVIISLENNYIPATINVEKPITNPKIKVLTNGLKLNAGLVGINSFSSNGNNYHCLLESISKSKSDVVLPKFNIPYSVGVSGRTEEAVNVILSGLETDAVDFEYIHLIHKIYEHKIDAHPYKGFLLISNGGKFPNIKYIQKSNIAKKHIWYLFPDLSVDRIAISPEILELEAVKPTIYKCHEALKYKSLDLLKILKEDFSSDPLHHYIGNAVLQLILIDLLSSLNMKPDGYVGYPVGEVACAYADGHVTVEEAILLFYHLAYFILKSGHIRKERIVTAVIGVPYDEIKNDLTPAVYCQPHKNVHFTVISGPLEVVDSFIEERKFVCKVKTYKDRYVAVKEHSLFELSEILNQVIISGKYRSKKWISISAPEHNKPLSAEYFANILLTSPRAEHYSSFIPSDVSLLVIGSDDNINEIYPNDADCHYVLPKNESFTIQSLLTTIGRLYTMGVDVDFGALYRPIIEKPASKGTKMISPLVQWDHGVDYNVLSSDSIASNERIVRVSLKDDKFKFICGHGIDIFVLYPGMGYLVLVWETYALLRHRLYTELSVVFENVRFSRATVIPRNGSEVIFRIVIQKISGYFELTENDQLVVAGYVNSPKNIQNEKYISIADESTPTDEDTILLNTSALYTEFYLRGYNYRGIFQSLINADTAGLKGRIKWENNWVPFLDCMLQLQLLQVTSGALIVPTAFEKIVIDVEKHKSDLAGNNEIAIYANKTLKITEAGGVQMKDVSYKPIPRKPFFKQPILLKYDFVPFVSTEDYPIKTIAAVFSEILMERAQAKPVNIAEVLNNNEPNNASFLSELLIIIKDLPNFYVEYTIEINENDFIAPINYEEGNLSTVYRPYDEKKFNLIVLNEPVYEIETFTLVLKYLTSDGFLVLKTKEKKNVNIPNNFTICCDYISTGYRILLLQRVEVQDNSLSNFIKISSQNYAWLSPLQNALKSLEEQKLYLVSENEPTCGCLGFYNCLRMERGSECVRLVSVMDAEVAPFSLEDDFYKSQLCKNLEVNIYKNGLWGRYIRLPTNSLQSIKAANAFVGVQKVSNRFKLNWFQGPSYSDTEKLIYPYYSAINTTDVLLLTGRIAIEALVYSPKHRDYVLGREFSGYGADGKRYMGICNNGALSTTLQYSDQLIVPVPAAWSLEDAGTVPLAYFTVLYAFTVLGKIKEGDAVLIHTATSIIGQAAISVASFYKCKIFLTVASAEEKTIIKSFVPHIPDNHIGNSNDDTIEQLVLFGTNGKGVNFVLSSLNEDKLKSSFNCVATNGHFIQTKKIDFNKGQVVSSAVLSKNVKCHWATFEDIIDLSVDKKIKLKQSFEDHLKAGAIKPLIRSNFEVADLDKALKSAVASRNTKKILIKIRPSDAFIDKIEYEAVPRFLCSPAKSVVVCGGLGGIGLQLINWLVIRGAQKVIVTSRNGVSTDYQKMQIAKWKSYGAEIVILKVNINTIEGSELLLKQANAVAPVAAIFNLAAVLKDKVFKNQTEEFFQISAEGKAIGTYNLDKCSRMQCPDLEHFVVFSSISCGYGNVGQSNYGMSNSTAERICEQRRADGLPALAVQWGAVGDVGMVMGLLGDNTDINIGGTLLQPIASCLESLEQFLLQKDTIVTSFVIADKNSKKK